MTAQKPLLHSEAPSKGPLITNELIGVVMNRKWPAAFGSSENPRWGGRSGEQPKIPGTQLGRTCSLLVIRACRVDGRGERQGMAPESSAVQVAAQDPLQGWESAAGKRGGTLASRFWAMERGIWGASTRTGPRPHRLPSPVAHTPCPGRVSVTAQGQAGTCQGHLALGVHQSLALP